MNEPVPQETVINLRPSGGAELAPRPVTAGKLVLATGGGVLALAVLGGAAVALFNVALTTVTIAAFGVALLAVIVLMPALTLALNAGRVRAKEAVADLAEGILLRLTRVLGGGTFSQRSPFAHWFEDVRALGFLRPPWGLAYDHLFASSLL